MPSEEKLARRRAFEKYKVALLRQNNIKTLICARCGYANRSNHLHHITEVVFGGDDAPDNLVPLCSECHREWDACAEAGMTLGEFLVSVCSSTLQLAIKRGLLISEAGLGESLVLLYRSQFVVNSLRCEEDYWAELEKQNGVFNTYPYSDQDAMLSRFGAMYEAA